VKIGVIAEDKSDVAVISALTLALLAPHQIGFRGFVGDGCGKLRRKCAAWADVLVREGFNWIIVVHDLDENREGELRALLTAAVNSAEPRAYVVLLPKREVEAWLLYDAAAIASAFREAKRPKLPANPESLDDPKKFLSDLIRKTYCKTYLNTIHNQIIAKHIDVASLRACQSFSPHRPFAADLKRTIEGGGTTARRSRKIRKRKGTGK
jgi:hypothetical protein